MDKLTISLFISNKHLKNLVHFLCFTLVLLLIGFRCVKETTTNPATVNTPKLDKSLVFSGFTPLWKLYLESSRGGWQNNDNGRFSNDDAPAMEAMLVLFELTDDTRYIDTFAAISVRIMKNDDIARQVVDIHRNKGILPGWSSTRYTGDSSRTIFMLDDALILIPMIRAYNLISKSTIEDYKKYNFKLSLDRAILEFDKVFVPEWIKKNDTEGYFQDIFYTKTDLNMPANQYAIIGVLCLELYKATNDSKYLEYAERMGRYLKNNLIIKNNSYVWYYKVPSQSYPQLVYDDFSHAQSVIQFIVKLYENKVVFTANDLNFINNTFLTQVLSPDNRVFKFLGGQINETTAAPEASKYVQYPWLTFFYLLIPYSDDVKQKMDSYNTTRTIQFNSNSDYNHFGEFVLLHYAFHLKYIAK